MPDSDYTSFTSSSVGIERTEVIKNPEDMVRITTKDFSKIKKRIDICCDVEGIRVTFEVKPIWNSYCELKDRGIRLRWITEVTKENIYYCKELAKIAELRHLDGIKSAFGIHDGIEYRASARVNSLGQLPRELIKTNVKEIVEQQQYVFDILWARAIPFKQRVREIEEGVIREFIDTIQDFGEIKQLLLATINSVTSEIMVIFPTSNTFHRYANTGIIKTLEELAFSKNITIRLLMPIKKGEISFQQLLKNYETIRKFSRLYHRGIDTRMAIFILDNEFSLTIEVKDDDKDNLEESTGLATYSNSESTVFSYVSIFENLWIENTQVN
jgi:hypothetical protein